MKKMIALVLLAVTLMSLFATSAMAAEDLTNYAFTYTAYTNGSTLNNANNFKSKGGTGDYIEVRHSVSGNGSGAGHTNYMYACVKNGSNYTYMGAKWQAPNGIYYACTSSTLKTLPKTVTPGGRANTKYADDGYGSSIVLTGQFRVH